MESTQGGKDLEPVVMMNVFELEKDVRDEDFIAHMNKCGEHLKQEDGYISHRLHQSLDPGARFRFINIAMWQSPHHFQMAVGSPAFRQLAALTPAKPAPGLYRVVAEAHKDN